MEEVFNENEMLSENQEYACMEECDKPEARTENDKEMAKSHKELISL